MTQDDIMKLALEAGPLTQGPFDAWCKRFAALVAAAEREACADIVDNADTPDCGGWNALGISRAIRARGTT